MARALSVTDLLNKKYNLFDLQGAWFNAFDKPSKAGAWFIWGNSGNGKTTFLLKLCKELCKYDRVLYNSLEEGDTHTMQKAVLNAGLASAKRRIAFVQESMEELTERLDKHKSYRIVVLDSFQYTNLSFEKYIAFIKRYPNKLFIINSQAEGKQPSGRTAKRVMYDASLKIWVEGYRAFSKGRYIGSVGYYTIWEQGANEYHGST